MAVRALADLGSQTFWLLGGMRMKSLWAVRKAQVVGIDLSANERQESGICLLREGKVRTWRVRTDDELVTLVQWLRPHLVAIDAPLSLPLSGWLRPCDRTLLRRGIRLFPVTMGGDAAIDRTRHPIEAAIRGDGLYSCGSVFGRCARCVGLTPQAP